MLILSVMIWIICVYSFKIFVSGNPAYVLVHSAPVPMLQEAADCLESEMLPDDETIYLFVKKFFRLTAIACLLFVIEGAIIFYFIYTEPKLTVPWLILAKNLIMIWMGYTLHRNAGENIFESVRLIPMWALRWERVSYLLTAAGFLFLFLLVNQLIPK